MSVGGGSEAEHLPTAKRLKDEKEPGEELTVNNRAKSKSRCAQKNEKPNSQTMSKLVDGTTRNPTFFKWGT